MTKIKTYPHHPFAEIFPFRDGDSLIELSDSIKENGQFDEIVLHERKVIEGRRRQAACIRAGVQPRFREFGSRPGDGADPLEYAFHVNYHRRDDMTEAEKVLAAVGYANLKRGDNQHTKEEVGTRVPSSQKEAAQKFGVNVKQLKRAKAVLEKGTPELQEAMRAEKVSVTDAAAIAGEAPEVQREAVAKVLAGEKGTLKEAMAAGRPDHAKDLREIARDLDGLAERLARVETPNVKGRDLACAGIRSARELVAKL